MRDKLRSDHLQRILISRRTLFELTLRVSLIISLLLIVFLPGDLEARIPLAITLVLFYIGIVKRFDYLDPLVGYLCPWLLILLFSVTKLSRFAISIHPSTYSLILLSIGCAVLVGGGARHIKIPKERRWLPPQKTRWNARLFFGIIDLFFMAFTIFNVVQAGYIPLIRGIVTGDTGYLDFGIHGIFGFYLAMANALAIIYLVVYLRTGKGRYLYRYIGIFCIFILFVSRQNVISSGIESIVAYSLVRKKASLKKIAIGLTVGGIFFSIVGNFRSGSIREIAGIDEDWVPDPVVWLYSYSYFNIANVDNLITHSNAPYYDGSSFDQLLPSFLRSENDIDKYSDYLLVINFTVASYMFPVYNDLGPAGVWVLTLIAIYLTSRKYAAIYRRSSIFQVGVYCVLYFCAAFSFFFNFWFYLPVIFQIFFFYLFGNLSEVLCHTEKKDARSKNGVKIVTLKIAKV
jgi:oligosaccharide repeat unit polymerase